VSCEPHRAVVVVGLPAVLQSNYWLGGDKPRSFTMSLAKVRVLLVACRSALHAAVATSSVVGCQGSGHRPGETDACPPLPSQVVRRYEHHPGPATIGARFMTPDSVVIKLAAMYLWPLSSSRAHGQVLRSDSTGALMPHELAATRYVIQARGIGVASRLDTVELRTDQSVTLHYFLPPEPNDRCGFAIVVPGSPPKRRP